MSVDCAFLIVEGIMFHSFKPANKTDCWAMLAVFLVTKRSPFTADLVACSCKLLILWKDSLHISGPCPLTVYTWVPLSHNQPGVWCSTTQNHLECFDGLPHHTLGKQLPWLLYFVNTVVFNQCVTALSPNGITVSQIWLNESSVKSQKRMQWQKCSYEFDNSNVFTIFFEI